MTPAEEVRRLNKLIRQYETVYHTTPDAGQRDRVERQLKELRDYREKILAVNVIPEQDLQEETGSADPLAAAPLLKAIAARNAALRPQEAVLPFAESDTPPTAVQLEMFHLALYLRFFEREYLPFLTEKQLKLDFKYSMDRDAFYSALQVLGRKLAEYRAEHRRLQDGQVSREMEAEVRKRTAKLTRFVQSDAARFFRAVERFCGDLEDDAHGDMVKCLNCNGVVRFDEIEGERVLQGRTVGGAVMELRQLAAEAVAYLNIPEIDGQENERADRH
jgi:hypothetical protein